MIGRGLLLLGALLVFGGVNWQIAGKERLRTSGEKVYLALAPVDPRSLMQGDYMALNFAVARAIQAPAEGGSHVAIVRLDPQRVGTYVRLDNGSPLSADERRLRFRMRNGAVWLGTNAFFFHEGDADRYFKARYGEFRVNSNGDALLVELRDKDLR